MRTDEILQLLDWKRQVFELYASVRHAPYPKQAWVEWRAGRDRLFASHPQSPLLPHDRESFSGLPSFDYEPSLRVLGKVEPAEPQHFDIATSGEEEGGTYGFTRFAKVRFDVDGTACSLDAFWLDGYGGGLFLPFRDATSGHSTYGGGRYLLDTVKGSDLGTADDGRLVLDFNFAYNPSCAYDPRWVCPLAPPGNRLTLEMRAGERYEREG